MSANINEEAKTAGTPQASSPETSFNFRKLGRYMLKRWWWFAISVAVIVGGAAYWLKTTNTTLTTYAKVMFNQDEDDAKPAAGMLGSLMASFNMGGSGVNVVDEIIRMQSHSAIKRVVNELDLNRDYSGSTSMWRKDIIYFQNSPIEIECPDAMLDTISYTTRFKLKIRDHGRKLHLKVKQGKLRTVFNQDIPRLPYTVTTPLGKFTITPTSFYKPEHDLDFTAYVSNPDDAAQEWFTNIDAYLDKKKSNAVEIKVDDKNAKRARAIANCVIDQYNINSVADRSARSKATLDFLNDRLLKLYNELERSGSGIAAYKERNKIVNPEAEAEYIFKMKGGATSTLIEQETQLGILRMLRDFLAASHNKHALIPVTSIEGQSTDAVNAAVNSYNELVLQLMQMQASAKGNNSTMRQLESQIEALRANMITSIDRSISAMQISIKRMSSENGTVDSRISSIPRMEQELTNMMRDNEIKNRIYAYLLQKREETEVKLVRTLPTGTIIDEAWTNGDTARPKKTLVLAGAALLALLIPGCILFTGYRRQAVTADKTRRKQEEDELTDEIG